MSRYKLNPKDIGTRIVFIRGARSQTQKEFSERIGVSQSALCKYENGAQIPSGEVVYAICASCGLDPMWLLSGEISENMTVKKIATHNLGIKDGWFLTKDDLLSTAGNVLKLLSGLRIEQAKNVLKKAKRMMQEQSFFNGCSDPEKLQAE